MRRFINQAFLLPLLLATLLMTAVALDGAWLKKIPQKDRERANPYEGDAKAAAVGKKLFQQNCAACHGDTAEGKGKRPNLHSDVIRNAKPGELQWLLKNGNLGAGMPSWSKLPEQQRWQIVSYLKTLD
jgi:mono/diheme cytochrome c family protein